VAAYDATQVNELGIIVDTGGTASYSTGTIYIDSIAANP
jgi:hypothetical protein